MFRRRFIVLMFVLALLAAGCGGAAGNAGPEAGTVGGTGAEDPASEQDPRQADAEAVRAVVEEFGRRLASVSLQAPEAAVRRALKEQYGDLVTPELLAAWQRDPRAAPGRVTSSPWPDRIEVLAVAERSPASYQVEGYVIEITSVEAVKGGAAARRPITLAFTRVEDRWLIRDVTLGDYEPADAVEYRNDAYGFRLTLPAGWSGYSIVMGAWEGIAVADDDAGEVVETGPRVAVRHPDWTEDAPRQDIPILVFTLEQWNALQQGAFRIGAAPVGPTELGRNSVYVFALPARYNYAFPEGYEEVERILAGKPLHPYEPGD